jgi:hypothetical protein
MDKKNNFQLDKQFIQFKKLKYIYDQYIKKNIYYI